LARPDVEDLFPKLWAARGCQAVRLVGLSATAAHQLVYEVLGDAATPGIAARLVDRAAGNAFYLEELIRAAANGQLEDLPDTILAMVQARLERLPSEARRILRAASVFGGEFWHGGVEMLVGASGDVARWLEDLAEQELIARRPSSKFPRDREYVFRHAIVREAAYATLVDSDRAQGHRLAGAWFEACGDAEPLLMAEHFERGGESARAVACYARAAGQALEGNDLASAVAIVDRAVKCGAQGEILGRLRLVDAEARNWRGEYVFGEASALEALAVLPRGADAWFAAVKQVAFASSKLRKADELVALASDVLAIERAGEVSHLHVVAIADLTSHLILSGARADITAAGFDWLENVKGRPGARHPAALAMVCETKAFRALLTGDEIESRRYLLAAIDFYEQAGCRRNASLCRGNLAYQQMGFGAFSAAEQGLQDVLRDAEHLGLHMLASWATQGLGLVAARLGRLEEAEQLVSRVALEAATHGDKQSEALSRCCLGFVLAESGKLEKAEQEAKTAVELAGAAPYRSTALAVLARVLLARGRAAEALGYAEEGIGAMEAKGCEEFESLLRLVHVEALRIVGRDEAARRAIGAARDRLLARAAKLGEADLRRSFLERVPEHVRTLALATELLRD
jgi:tetratricopeptide (TPR) repeat protein